MRRFLVPLIAVLGLFSCGYPEAEFVSRGDTLDMTGVIDADTRDTLETALNAPTPITTIRLVNVPGSADDENSLRQLTQLIQTAGLTTTVPSNGMVASGGTDMLLMGRKRIIEPGACIGVHSWAAGYFGISSQNGADLPRDSEEHALYLEFYEQIGIDPAFYWFTLDVADANDMHWMSPEEINRFKLSSTPVAPDNLDANTRAERCWSRLG